MNNHEVLAAIREEGLVSPSLFTILYGETEDSQLDTLSDSERIVHVYRLFLFYAMLIHAYTVARALAKEPPCTVRDLDLPSDTGRQILNYWNGPLDMSEGNNVFSFLSAWVRKSGDRIVFDVRDEDEIGELTELIRLFSERYTEYTGTVRMMPRFEGDPCYINSNYCELLRLMPLLKNTSVSEDCFGFTVNGQTISAPCLPFLFHNQNASLLENCPRNQAYLFTSMKEGEKNDWPIIRIFPLHGGNSRQIRVDAANESIRMVCQAVGITTVWYPVDDCWCDLAYLKKVIDATIHALMKYCKINLAIKRKNIYPAIRDLYAGTELYDKLPALVGDNCIYSTRNEIEAFLYDMFINLGVFKSLYGLFFDGGDAGSGVKPKDYAAPMFQLFISYFLANGDATQAKVDAVMADIDKGIEKHLNKLQKIRKEGTEGFDLRRREIYAEWYAYAILRISGIKTQIAPFADRERMLSIEDYARMIRNPETKLEDSLRDVLLLLNCIYGPLVEAGEAAEKQAGPDGDPEEEIKPSKTFFRQYYGQVSKQVDALMNADLPELFDRFGDIAERSDHNPAVSKLLGRHNICSRDTVIAFREEILQKLQLPAENCSVSAIDPSAPKVFISYNHADRQIVSLLCGRLSDAGLSLYQDDLDFHSNDDWRFEVQREIQSGNCAAVVLFAGEHIADRDTICYELEEAQNNHIPVFTVNILDPDKYTGDNYNLYTFLRNIKNRELSDQMTEKWRNASKLTSSIDCLRSNDVIYRTPKDFDRIISDVHAAVEKKKAENKKNGTEDSGDIIGVLLKSGDLSPLEEVILYFYDFLRKGYDQSDGECSLANEDDPAGMQKDLPVNRCIFPLVISVRETMIKRDKIALIGYEIIKTGEGKARKQKQYILSSRRLETDDYYCIPNYRLTDSKGKWMVEPLLIKRSALIKDI